MNTDRILSTVGRPPLRGPLVKLGVRFAVALLLFAVGSPVEALLVGVTAGTIPDTSQNPANTAGWTQGDPGWNNAVRLGYLQPNGQTYYQFNGVYLGDGWVLTAAHTGTPTSVLFESGATFAPVPHPSNQDQSFQIANPSWNDPRLIQGLADLRLIRINGDPGVPSLPIATQALANNDQIVMIAGGATREAPQKHFLVDTNTTPWTWPVPTDTPENPNPSDPTNTPCSGPSCYNGYRSYGNSKRWGTNRVTSSDSVLGENDGNLQTVVSGGTIAYVTTYDQNANVVTDKYESEAVGGDSGSGVFFKRGGQWQLSGLMLAKYYFSGQTPNLDPSNTWAIFGNANAFADLATYNDPNHDGNAADSLIKATMNAHQDYSLVADLNLDGVAGTAADLSAFVAGWRYNNGSGTGTITSWKNGDVTHDGKTDINDFLLLRSNLTPGAGAELTVLMSSYISGGVPEPSTAMLILGPAILFALRARRRRPRLAA